MQLQNKNMWAKICACGNLVSITTKDSPFLLSNNITKRKKCNNCGKYLSITTKDAYNYVLNQISNTFKNISGNVLEIGCGGGFLTKQLKNNKSIKQLIVCDCEAENLPNFVQIDLNNFNEKIFNMHFDYIVCKDVLMYLKNIDYTFNKLSKISTNICLLNWYNKSHKNCINKTEPQNILNILSKYYNNLELIYPQYYKYGYIIKTKNII